MSKVFQENYHSLQEWGTNTHSFLSLYPNVEHFTLEGVQGFIPYVETANLVLVAGDPIAPQKAILFLIGGLLRYSLERGKRLGMLPARGAYRALLEEIGFDTVYIGKEPMFDLKRLPKLGKANRQAVNRAVRRGIKIVEYDKSYREDLERLSNRWQNGHEIPPLQFLFQLRPLELEEHKKIFLAISQDGNLLAFLSCSPIYARNGWYLEDLIRHENAPNGTSELLLTRSMEKLSEEGFEIATLALAPLAGLPDSDENHPWLNRLLRLAYSHLSWIYHFQTLEFFKSKFKPSYWEPNYFYFYPAGVDIKLIKDLLEAFIGDSLIRVVCHKVRKIIPGDKSRVA